MWSAIIGAVSGLVSGVLSYASGKSSQEEARKLAEQQRGDVLAQQAKTNKLNEEQVDLGKQRQAFDIYNTMQQNKTAQQQQNISELQKTAQSFADKANASPLYRQQLLSMWK